MLQVKIDAFKQYHCYYIAMIVQCIFHTSNNKLIKDAG